MRSLLLQANKPDPEVRERCRVRRLPFVYSPSGCAGQCGLLEDSWYFLALAGCGRRCATLFCRVARCVPTSTERQLRQYGCLDFPRQSPVADRAWRFSISHIEECSELRLCAVTTVLQAEWFWFSFSWSLFKNSA